MMTSIPSVLETYPSFNGGLVFAGGGGSRKPEHIPTFQPPPALNLFKIRSGWL